jgi:hypothetical protein
MIADRTRTTLLVFHARRSRPVISTLLSSVNCLWRTFRSAMSSSPASDIAIAVCCCPTSYGGLVAMNAEDPDNGARPTFGKPGELDDAV